MNTLNITLNPVPFTANDGRGRPQTNPRLYLSLVGCEALKREGWTEKQLRRRAFAQARALLGLPKDVVIAESVDGSYYMVKSTSLKTNVVVIATPATWKP